MTRSSLHPACALVLFAGRFRTRDRRLLRAAALRPLAVYYVTQAPVELGVANIVTGILITYRGFDTLGEVAVLFMVAASVGILLDTGQAPVADVESAPARRAPSEIVATCTGSAGAADPGLRRLCHRKRPSVGRRRLPGRRHRGVRPHAAIAGPAPSTGSTSACSASPNRWRAFSMSCAWHSRDGLRRRLPRRPLPAARAEFGTFISAGAIPLISACSASRSGPNSASSSTGSGS